MSVVTVGQGGNYATVYDALASGATNIQVISNVVENKSWLFPESNLEYAINIVPSATVFYTGIDPFITSNNQGVSFYISISGGSIILTQAQYITSTPNIPNSCVKFEFVSLELRAIATYFSSNILLLLQCNVNCNTLFLSDTNNTVVTADKNTFVGNVLLSSQGFDNLQVRLTNNIVYGSLTVYSNAVDITLDKRNNFPLTYTIDNNTIGILGLNEAPGTSGTRVYFCGLALVGNTIGTLFVASDLAAGIAFSNISNNNINNNDMSNNSNASWCSLFSVNMNLNKFETALHLGDILYSTINDNSFTDVNLGSNDLSTGSLDRSKFIDNVLNTLIINEGLNVSTDISANEILSIDPLSCVINANMEECLIHDNNISGNLNFNGIMTNNEINGNSVSIIRFNGLVDGDVITDQTNTTIEYFKDVSHLSLITNRNLFATFNGIVTSSIISNNFSPVIIFKGKVSSTIISSNIGEGSVTFQGRVSSSQIINNVYIAISLSHKACKSIIRDNIMHKHKHACK